MNPRTYENDSDGGVDTSGVRHCFYARRSVVFLLLKYLARLHKCCIATHTL